MSRVLVIQGKNISIVTVPYNTTKKIITKLIKNKINARKPWYPNHLQKPFKKYQNYKITNALKVFKNSICMPSNIDLNYKQIQKISKFLK